MIYKTSENVEDDCDQYLSDVTVMITQLKLHDMYFCTWEEWSNAHRIVSRLRK